MNRRQTAHRCNERPGVHRAAEGLWAHHRRDPHYRPDAPSLLQLFVWQEHDLAPDFPVLFDFLDHWRLEIRAALHSVTIAHDRLIRPTEWRAVDGIITIQ